MTKLKSRLNMKIIILVLLITLQLATCPSALASPHSVRDFAGPLAEGPRAQRGATFSEKAPFIYDSQGSRDPFMPLLTKDGRPVTVYGSISSIGDVVIEGILFDPRGESFVVINDIILKQEDSISGVTVKKIEKNSVVLSFKGEDHTFKIKE
jgi:type II secretory pathway component PulC